MDWITRLRSTLSSSRCLLRLGCRGEVRQEKVTSYDPLFETWAALDRSRCYRPTLMDVVLIHQISSACNLSDFLTEHPDTALAFSRDRRLEIAFTDTFFTSVISWNLGAVNLLPRRPLQNSALQQIIFHDKSAAKHQYTHSCIYVRHCNHRPALYDSHSKTTSYNPHHSLVHLSTRLFTVEFGKKSLEGQATTVLYTSSSYSPLHTQDTHSGIWQPTRHSQWIQEL